MTSLQNSVRKQKKQEFTSGIQGMQFLAALLILVSAPAIRVPAQEYTRGIIRQL